MKKFSINTVFVALLLATGCSVITGSQKDVNLLGSEWELVAIQLEEGEKQIAANQFTLAFKQDLSISGKADCNNYFGSLEFGVGNEIQFRSIGATRAFCGDDSDFTSYMESLNKVVDFEWQKETLQLNTSKGGVLSFRKK